MRHGELTQIESLIALSDKKLFLTLLLLGGCATADLETAGRPVLGLEFGPAYRNEAAPHAGLHALPNTYWWRNLAGPELESLVQELVAGNYDLQSARHRIQQAEALRRQVRSSLFPTIGASIEAQSIGQDVANEWQWTDAASAGLGVDWAVDVFGRTRSSAQAERLRYLSQVSLAKDVRQQLVTKLVATYIQGWAAQEQLLVARAYAESYQESLDITRQRYRSGSSSSTALDVALAEQNLAAAVADIPELEARVRILSQSIDVLVGRLPQSDTISFGDLRSAHDLEPVAAGLPGDLLLRRADVRAAGLQYSAALQDVNAARASLLPSFSLSASIGATTDDISDVFDPASLGASLLANLTAPIFQGGRLRAQVDQFEAAAAELSANLSAAVLEAVFDVEQALVLDHALAEAVLRADASLEAATIADQLSRERYATGQADLLTVLEARRALNIARLTALSIQQSRLEARVSLYAALGGDWLLDDEQE